MTNSETFRARRIVIATGFNRVPILPRWAGLDTFTGTVIHSSEYTNGERFRGSRVLVVGFGNSGAEIALDLAEQGAHCTISVRGKVNVVPRQVLGIPITMFALASRPLPPRVADRLNRLTVRLTIGSLSSTGLVKSDVGPLQTIAERRRIPVIDVGTMARIRAETSRFVEVSSHSMGTKFDFVGRNPRTVRRGGVRDRFFHGPSRHASGPPGRSRRPRSTAGQRSRVGRSRPLLLRLRRDVDWNAAADRDRGQGDRSFDRGGSLRSRDGSKPRAHRAFSRLCLMVRLGFRFRDLDSATRA